MDHGLTIYPMILDLASRSIPGAAPHRYGAPGSGTKACL